MDNKKIAKSFQLLGKLMELHGENPFKVRSYYNAYNVLRKLENPLTDMSTMEIGEIKGMGKAIVEKIESLKDTGKMPSLERFKEMTPPGVIDMLQVRGFGPKKVSAIWNQLGIETIGELQQACVENRLVSLKGFGLKTQEDLSKRLAYHAASKGWIHFATAIPSLREIASMISDKFPQDVAIVGQAAREEQVISSIQLLVTEERCEECIEFVKVHQDDEMAHLNWKGIQLDMIQVPASQFAAEQFLQNSTEEFLDYMMDEYGFDAAEFEDELNEEAIFEVLGMPFVPAPCRELYAFRPADITYDDLITDKDIKGIIHAHSTYSDGLHSLEEMAKYCKAQGMEYLVITDHSQSAFYADGLKTEAVLRQWKEIDELNERMKDFHIFKGIESDILHDGSLDYEEEMLNGFDLVIASIHSQLKMTEEKATSRLIRAIEHPCTRILGHPTGRLLLSREGYPIDHKQVIDACAEHNVVIELNAHPNRLDIDYHWIDYCREKNVMISINPDAHSKEAIHMVSHGVRMARKIWVQAQENLSSFSLAEIKAWIHKK